MNKFSQASRLAKRYGIGVVALKEAFEKELTKLLEARKDRIKAKVSALPPPRGGRGTELERTGEGISARCLMGRL